MKRILALFALTLGGFAIGITEFATMGVLPDIASNMLPGYEADPQRVIAQAGTIISLYALGVVIGAPVIAILCVRMSLTSLARWSLVVLGAANLASALMPSFELVSVFRFASGLPHGIYLGVAALLSAKTLGPGNMGKGIAISMIGLTTANVVGVPFSTMLGQAFGWRWVYGVVAALFALALLLVVLFVEKLPGNPERTARSEIRALGNYRVWLMIGTLAVGSGGFFAVYSYIADVTTREVGLGPEIVPWVTATLGVGMVIGNFLGGVLADRHLNRAAIFGLVLAVLVFIAYSLFAGAPIRLFIFAFLVSASTMMFGPAVQARLIRVANGADLLGASMNHAASNMANSLGAWLGGLVIAAGLGYLAPGWVGAVLAALGLVIMLVSIAVERRDKARSLDTGGVPVVG